MNESFFSNEKSGLLHKKGGTPIFFSTYEDTYSGSGTTVFQRHQARQITYQKQKLHHRMGTN